MTREQFKALPHLVRETDVKALGYSASTLDKFVSCGVLKKIKPPGTHSARFQKKQLAQLLHWEELLDVAAFKAEPPFMQVKAVQRWTGFSENTLTNLAHAMGNGTVKPPGARTVKFLKATVAEWIGFEQYV